MLLNVPGICSHMTRFLVLMEIFLQDCLTYFEQYCRQRFYTCRIVKTRIQQKIECYEVEWQNVQLGETCPTFFVTIETREVIKNKNNKLIAMMMMMMMMYSCSMSQC